MWANANVMAALPDIGSALCSMPQSFFYVSIFLYFVLTDCDQLLTSFQEGPYQT